MAAVGGENALLDLNSASDDLRRPVTKVVEAALGVSYDPFLKMASGWPDDPQTLDWLRDRAVDDPDRGVRRVAEEAANELDDSME